jgi:hypothetical protein
LDAATPGRKILRHEHEAHGADDSTTAAANRKL